MGKLIYVPKGKAREYSPLALNIYNGCDHQCKYCYVRLMRRGNNPARPTPREDFLRNLSKELDKEAINEQVFLCFMNDPYCDAETRLQMTRQTLELLLEKQVPTAILTKGGGRALRDADLFSQFHDIKVGATLTFVEVEDSIEWEPGAAVPMSRLNMLKRLHDRGVKTWVSLEPVIDPVQTLELIRLTHKYVDQYKVGKLNHHPLAKEIDWADFGQKAVDMLRAYGKDFYVKIDLQPYVDRLRLHEADMNALSLERTHPTTLF